ncbi:MAG TPA: TetR/AcrR family transcriptional regulator C-terminal domain-containing protein, partial [Steroidobacteraceae bacterium]
ISAAALSIADAGGFEAVSMRRIAAHLGASTMSLYYYIHTKADLVALMDDALMGEILVPEGQLPQGWRKAMSTIARRTRDVLTRHPWALLSMRGAPPGPNAMRHFEQSLEALEDAPMSVEGKLTVLQLVDDFVFGHSLRTAEARGWFGDTKLTRSAEALGDALFKTGAFPRTAALFGSANSPEAARYRQLLTEDRFEHALAAVLDGAAQLLSQARQSRRGATSARGR